MSSLLCWISCSIACLVYLFTPPVSAMDDNSLDMPGLHHRSFGKSLPGSVRACRIPPAQLFPPSRLARSISPWSCTSLYLPHCWQTAWLVPQGPRSSHVSFSFSYVWHIATASIQASRLPSSPRLSRAHSLPNKPFRATRRHCTPSGHAALCLATCSCLFPGVRKTPNPYHSDSNFAHEKFSESPLQQGVRAEVQHRQSLGLEATGILHSMLGALNF